MKKIKKMRGGGMASAGGRTSPSSSGSVAGRGPSGGRTSPSSSGSVAGRGPSTSNRGRFAAGGIVKAQARSYKDMRAGAGSGVGRLQKTKIAGRGR